MAFVSTSNVSPPIPSPVTNSGSPLPSQPATTPPSVTAVPDLAVAATAVRFPVCRADGREFANFQEIEALLAGEPGGQFLLGRNRSWHGGIHVTASSMPHHQSKHPLRCMMDGTVIAYRLNRGYPTTEWCGQPLAFSNGFCLIRHDYCSPPAPVTQNPDGAAAASSMPAQRNRLRLYSLYMHLADYQHYQPEVIQERTLTLLKKLYVRNGNDANRRLGKLAAGSIITLLDVPSCSLQIQDQGVTRTLRFLKGKVTQKAAGSQTRVRLQAEVWMADCEEYVRHGQQPRTTGGATAPAYWQISVKARLRNPYPIYRSRADLLADQAPEGRLQVGSTLQFKRGDLQTQLLGGVSKQIVPCELLAGVSGSSTEPVTGVVWVVVDAHQWELQPQAPTEFDAVVTCSVPIAAGDPVGFLGLHQSPSEPLALGGYQDEYRVHIELFSDEEATVLQRFLQNEAGVDAGQSLLHLQGQEALFDRVQVEGGISFNDRCQCPDPDQWLPIRSRVTDASGQSWCELGPVKSGFAALNSVYVREQEVSPIRQLDLARQGFTLMQGQDSAGGIVLAEQTIPTLFATIHQQLDSNHDGEISADEIAAALNSTENREKLNKLIIQHPSEWGSAYQQQIEQYLQQLIGQSSNETGRQLLDLERQRLRTMQIDVIGRSLYAFHPLFLISHLIVLAEQAALVVLEMLELLAPGISQQDCTLLLTYLNRYMPKYQINTPLRICHFLSQVAHESNFSPHAENLNYRAERMREIYGCNGGPAKYLPAEDDCLNGRKPEREGLWSNEDQYAHHPQALANLVYSGRMENGTEASGDGYKYRGRGLIQLTGRDNYTCYTEVHNNFYPGDPKDFLQDPDLLVNDLRYAVESACFYWQKRGVNEVADLDSVANVTIKVNGGSNGLADRTTRFLAIKNYYSSQGLI
jgi:predicted chitinase